MISAFFQVSWDWQSRSRICNDRVPEELCRRADPFPTAPGSARLKLSCQISPYASLELCLL